jgi:hypothetical protein
MRVTFTVHWISLASETSPVRVLSSGSELDMGATFLSILLLLSS